MSAYCFSCWNRNESVASDQLSTVHLQSGTRIEASPNQALVTVPKPSRWRFCGHVPGSSIFVWGEGDDVSSLRVGQWLLVVMSGETGFAHSLCGGWMYRYGFLLSYVRVRNRIAWQWALVVMS